MAKLKVEFKMEMTFRWYGEDDLVTLKKITQIPCVTGIVSALNDVPVGDVWPVEEIEDLKAKVEDNGLRLSVIESIPVHEDIKLGLPARDELIENYCRSIRNMGSLGIDLLCYNFMPVFDWTRSELSMVNPDGSTCLSYDHAGLEDVDLKKDSLELPGWATLYTKDELTRLIDAYSELDEETLWLNLEYFLKRVIPAAEDSGVRMCIHPDDPPWPIFGLPRIIRDEAALDRLVRLVDSESNGITFCTGSLGPNRSIDLAGCIRKFGSMGRIHFVHCRNIKRTGEFSFYECEHLSESGDIDMFEIMKALVETGFSGAIRPDHGRMIWGETGKPGYGLYDRALGAMYLSGLWEAVQKGLKKE